ncbi:MAG: hypothetical protein H5T73_05165 [Actinobacteria bacterium]|nr:hypothetical protein [Actinomycetota bacterium]
MKVVVVRPGRVLAAGAACAALLLAALAGWAAFSGALRGERAQAYGKNNVGSLAWFFAEGHTGDGFEEWICIFNPPYEVGGSGRVAMVRIGYFGPGGFIGHDYIQLEPGQRASVNVNQQLKQGYNYAGDVSVAVISWENNAPVICERAMYYNYQGRITGGSQAPGYEEAEVAAPPY